MIIDAAKTALGEAIHCDVAIVGSGAAGITLGLKLARQGVSVVIAEAGGKHSSDDSQRFFAGEVEGQRPVPLENLRQRCLGGTTTIWGGRCIPFDPIDLKKRPWLENSGWPIQYDELACFYPEALEWCHAGRPEFSAAALGIPEMISGFSDGDVTTDNSERWSLPTNFGRDYRNELESNPNVKLLLNAPCVDIRLEEGKKHVANLVLQGKDRTRLHAKSFSLCVGGLEVPRLLLASNSQQSRGIGNDRDVVGRYYMGHLIGIIAQIVFEPQRKVDVGYVKDIDGVYVRRRLSISEEVQRQHAFPNMAALLHHPMPGNPKHGSGILSLIYLAIFMRRSFRAQIPPCFLGLEPGGYSQSQLIMSHVANVLKDLPAVLTHFPGFALKRFIPKRRMPQIMPPNHTGRYPIYYHMEQEPNNYSRVTLSDKTDDLGVPRLKSEFRTSSADLERVMRVHDYLADYFARNEIGRLEYLSKTPQQDALEQFNMGDAHFIGTTRMGEDPATSVVDSDCRVHGYDNLYIVSSSVFPTSGQANPTLTIIALALRTAAIIKRRLQA